MSVPPDVVSTLNAAGRTQRLQYQFTAHLRDPKNSPAPEGVEDRRMGIYRDLVFSNVESFVASNFPVIRTLYDDASWNVLAREFFRDHRCHTPLFPEFAREFLRYIETRQQDGRDDPPFLLELAHYEWSELALSLDEADIDSIAHDADGDLLSGVPVLSPLCWVLGYHFAVQHIGPDFRPQLVPPEPTLLLLVRSRNHEVRFHEINALTAVLVERLRENTDSSGMQCLESLFADRPAAEAHALCEAGKNMLLELKNFEAILGTR